MTVGITHTLKMLADIKTILVDVVSIAKHGIGFGAVQQVFEMLGEVKGIISEAPGVLPEIKDIDSAEAGQIAAASYDLVKSLVVAITK